MPGSGGSRESERRYSQNIRAAERSSIMRSLYFRFERGVGLIVLMAMMALSGSIRGQAQEDKKSELAGWERSVVTIEVARKQYDYYQPWTKRTRRFQKIGTVFGDHQILTTADELFG